MPRKFKEAKLQGLEIMQWEKIKTDLFSKWLDGKKRVHMFQKCLNNNLYYIAGEGAFL